MPVEARFSAPVQTGPGAHPPSSSARVKERVELYEDEGEDVSSYWMTLRKREDTGN
jgi:hypothetical protein